MILYCAIAIVLSAPIDPRVLEALYDWRHLVFLAARLPQIWMNLRSKSTGQLSFWTCLMNLVGSMASTFTSSLEVNASFSMVLGLVLLVFADGIIMSQILLYRTKGKEEENDSMKRKKKLCKLVIVKKIR
ncbi:unnamed protein product [Microthlaspi erraticum]|uniref:Uncharacterized protein n=1 Tax=Microthlaspi erraticum TaxID=1685480 RepID=A0A6D2IP33_9BRAS|nr:unnamed protein product [Microthlaspi erraticum]